MSIDSTKELIFQNEIIAQMEEKGWIRGKTDGYDRAVLARCADLCADHTAAGMGEICQNLSFGYRASFPRCAGGAAEKSGYQRYRYAFTHLRHARRAASWDQKP